MITKSVIKKCAQQHDCFYLYDEEGIIGSLSDLKAHFPYIDFLYSIKCNSNPHVMRSIFRQGLGADAASLGEVLSASEMGLGPDQIFYSAPGKTISDIEGALSRSTIIADSLSEVARIQQAAERTGRTVSIGLRINPDYTFSGDSGQPSKFGVDEDEAFRFLQECSYENVRITGIHVHIKSQELSADALAAYYEKTLLLAERFARICGRLGFVNLGSGIGVPYTEQDAPVDLDRLASLVRDQFREFQDSHPGTRLMIEVGRYAVCKHGIYVTQVLDRKVSHGTTYLILKNTLNGFVRPSLARLIEKYAQDGALPPAEPLFTDLHPSQFLPLSDSKESEVVTLVGNLCTAADVIAENVIMPHLECGDLIAITNAGSYADVLTPMQFSTQEVPAERFLTCDNELV